MNYSKRILEIFKRVIKDYELLKNDINEKIEKGYTIENLEDYVRHLSSCNITNTRISNDIKKYDWEYIDFNYCDMCVSIYQENGNVYLGNSIEVWDDKNCAYIGYFNNINDLKNILKGGEINE